MRPQEKTRVPNAGDSTAASPTTSGSKLRDWAGAAAEGAAGYPLSWFGTTIRTRLPRRGRHAGATTLRSTPTPTA